MIKRFGSSERKSKFENANKGLTRLAGKTDWLFRQRVGLRVWIQTRNKRKQKKDGIAGTEFFFFSGQKATRGFSFFKRSFGWEGPERAGSSFGSWFGFGKTRCKGAETKSFANDLKRPIEFNGKYLNKTRIFTTKELQGKFLQVPKRVLIKLAMKEKVWNSGLGWSHCRHLIFSQRGRPLAVLKKRWQKETQD